MKELRCSIHARIKETFLWIDGTERDLEQIWYLFHRTPGVAGEFGEHIGDSYRDQKGNKFYFDSLVGSKKYLKEIVEKFNKRNPDYKLVIDQTIHKEPPVTFHFERMDDGDKCEEYSPAVWQFCIVPDRFNCNHDLRALTEGGPLESELITLVSYQEDNFGEFSGCHFEMPCEKFPTFKSALDWVVNQSTDEYIFENIIK